MATENKIFAVWGAPNSGKTTLAANMATLMADTGYMTCLISASYHGEFQAFFGTAIPKGKGLYAAITGGKHIRESLVETRKNLCILELDSVGDSFDISNITTKQFERLISQLSDLFEYIFIDCAHHNASVFTGMGIVSSDVVLMCVPHRVSAATWYISNYQMIDALREKILYIDCDIRKGGADMEQLLSSIHVKRCDARVSHVKSAFFWENAGLPIISNRGREERRYKKDVQAVLALLMDHDAHMQLNRRVLALSVEH